MNKPKQKQTHEEQGITLISLIVTIIILIILAVISIRMLTDGGLLDQVKEGKNAHIEAETKENSILADTGDILKSYVYGEETKWTYDSDGNVTNGTITIEIGSYVDYVAEDETYISEEEDNGYADQKFDTSTKAADMLFNLDSDYWLANQGLRLRENGGFYGIGAIYAYASDYSEISNGFGFTASTTGRESKDYYYVRPVVSLSSDITLTGDNENGWTIVKS